MTNKEFAIIAKYIAEKVSTIYMKGVIGNKVTQTIVNQKKKQYPLWYTSSKIKKRFEPLYDKNYYGFDCVCLIKAILWGWGSDMESDDCGVVYESNDVPDFTTSGMLSYCTDVSTDFSVIEVGEVLWMSGHVGIYIGDGYAVECTTSGSGDVQITACNCKKQDVNTRVWTKHGKLMFVEYEKEEIKKASIECERRVLKRGTKCNEVSIMQSLLLAKGYSVDIDGSFGKKTEEVLKKYQEDNNLEVDGSCGKKTWKSLLEYFDD